MTTQIEFGEKVVHLLEGLNELDNLRAAQIRQIQQDVEELRRGMAALAEVSALRSELADLRADIREDIAEATATPFDPPPATDA